MTAGQNAWLDPTRLKSDWSLVMHSFRLDFGGLGPFPILSRSESGLLELRTPNGVKKIKEGFFSVIEPDYEPFKVWMDIVHI